MKTSIKNFDGKLLRQLIKENGISQEEFAEKLGYSVQSVSYWVRGKKTPNPDTLKNIADYFNIAKECLTGDMPLLCTQQEYDNIPKEFTKSLNFNTLNLQSHKQTKLLFQYLIFYGEQYNTFDYEELDKGVLGNKAKFRIIENIVNRQIEKCFLDLGIITNTEKRGVENG